MKTHLSTRGHATLSLILSAACWGLATVLTKRVLQDVPPLTLLVAQLLVSVIFLWLMIAGRRIAVSFDRQAFLLSLTGLLNPGLAYTLSLLGLTLTSASMSTLIWAAEPILILGLAWLTLRERVTPPMLVCAFIGILGVMLVAGLNTGPNQAHFLVGNLLTVAGVFCCAAYSVVSRRLINRLHPLVFVALQQTAALILVVVLWPIELGQVGPSSLAHIRPNLWAWTALSGIVYYALAYWFYLTGLETVPVSRASLFFNLIPIFGVGAAYVFLGERLEVSQWLGALLILGAMVGVVRLQFAKPDLTSDLAQA
jgi:drug/metabolite transporter (DMT)-like permease